MKRAIGAVVLGLSACGYPLTQLAVRRWGRRGAAVAECVCAGLAIRDATMVASGIPARLRVVPAALLRLELAAAAAASLTGARPLLGARPAGTAAPPGATDTLWRAAVAALFALHTIRFGIYLTPDQGRRRQQGDAGPGTGIRSGRSGAGFGLFWIGWRPAAGFAVEGGGRADGRTVSLIGGW